MRPGEFWESLAAWQADKEADRRHVAEIIRAVGFRLFNIQLVKEDQLKDVRKFLPFPWDDDPDYDEEAGRLSSLPQKERDAEAQAFLESINWNK